MQLFPLRMIRVDPVNLGSADCHLIGRADTGHDYAIKVSLPENPHLPVSGWIGHHLAQACGIPVPDWEQVELPDGRLGFGSRWEGGTLPDQMAMTEWLLGLEPVPPELPGLLSAVFAFDLFVHNDDRHLGNFLVRTGRNAARVVLAGDYSRALLYHPWPPPVGFPPCNTLAERGRTSAAFGYDVARSEQVLNRLSQIDGARWSTILNAMPDVWGGAALRTLLTDWWDTERLGRGRDAVAPAFMLTKPCFAVRNRTTPFKVSDAL